MRYNILNTHRVIDLIYCNFTSPLRRGVKVKGVEQELFYE